MDRCCSRTTVDENLILRPDFWLKCVQMRLKVYSGFSRDRENKAAPRLRSAQSGTPDGQAC